MKPFTLNRPHQVKMSLDEADLLNRLKDSPEWAVLKNVCSRYVSELQKANFWTPYSDEKLREKHAEAVGQAYGIEKMITLVEESGKKSSKGVVKDV